jgi:NADPH-dependent 7-cyano-7-deazaguanine reductase QueF-like protein
MDRRPSYLKPSKSYKDYLNEYQATLPERFRINLESRMDEDESEYMKAECSWHGKKPETV